MKTLVVPTDFSSVSVNAMNYAVDMAQAINAGYSVTARVQCTGILY